VTQQTHKLITNNLRSLELVLVTRISLNTQHIIWQETPVRVIKFRKRSTKTEIEKIKSVVSNRSGVDYAILFGSALKHLLPIAISISWSEEIWTKPEDGFINGTGSELTDPSISSYKNAKRCSIAAYLPGFPRRPW